VIEASGVVKSFGPRTILRGIDLTVQEGETLVIIGGSGCGKSTFLKCVIGLHTPDSGKLTVDGLEVAKLKTDEEIADYRRRFGYLFQEGALFDSMTVAENITFGLRYLTKDPPSSYRKIATDCLALVGLKDVEDFKPSELSGGMKKRVALARAIAAKPMYILYDEPTTGLDPIMSDVINDLILDLQKQLKVTSIVVTHDMKSAYKVASRIAMFYEGRVIQVGTPDEIKSTKDAHVRQFIEGLSVGPIKMKLKEFDVDDSHDRAADAPAAPAASKGKR
jgi:phospholipid/cholesterol/gamma-HCH transport system ATP-binding protein